jgi:ATP-dependent DNA ligase
MKAAADKLELEGIVSKRLTAPYKTGPSKSRVKRRNPVAGASADQHNRQRERSYHGLCATADPEGRLSLRRNSRDVLRVIPKLDER